MPWNDSPYTITHAFQEHSEYTLKLPNNPTPSVWKSGPVRFFDVQIGQPQPVYQIPK
jgi:hypothetical protein